ncbi:hypothetical protein Pogu_1893 [Pyrobaculum oguniense TE7]|uniref:Uncharacterized protein n=1 Tax=Pyrobaculum oguniense (strain DSM 13380 / JCM 10595 / TE7) TaxID=698757 RepID=H6QAZ7_PYROT|nr:hypothetical protein Pogu_1893 [Pyrobaculum oguniense TE7]
MSKTGDIHVSTCPPPRYRGWAYWPKTGPRGVLKARTMIEGLTPTTHWGNRWDIHVDAATENLFEALYGLGLLQRPYSF